MTRNPTLATSLAALMIAVAPAAQAMMNLPNNQINQVPQTPPAPSAIPNVSTPIATPKIDVDRLSGQGEDDGGTDGNSEDNQRAEAPQASSPPIAPRPHDRIDRTEQLADIADLEIPIPLPRPDREGLNRDDNGQSDLAEVGQPDLAPDHETRGPDVHGNGVDPRIAALFERLGGGGPERAQMLDRLRQFRELGNGFGLEVGDFGRENDCGPGVNVPSGKEIAGLGGCDSGGNDGLDGKGPRDRGFGPTGGYGPTDPGNRYGRYPRPEISADGGTDDPDSFVDLGSGSATSGSGMKNVGSGQASYGPDDAAGGKSGAAAGANSESDTGSEGAPAVESTQTYRDEQGRVISRVRQHSDGSTAETSTIYFDDGGSVSFLYKDGESQGYILKDGDGGTKWITPSDMKNPSQPDPRGPQTGNGGAGGDCLTLGIRCGLAKKQNDSWLKDATRVGGRGSGHDVLTPREIMEMVGQPVPTDPWFATGNRSATGPSLSGQGIAGLTPGCDADPGGCGGADMSTGQADIGADMVDTSIVGLTPGCDADPSGCDGAGSVRAAAPESP